MVSAYCINIFQTFNYQLKKLLALFSNNTYFVTFKELINILQGLICFEKYCRSLNIEQENREKEKEKEKSAFVAGGTNGAANVENETGKQGRGDPVEKICSFVLINEKQNIEV